MIVFKVEDGFQPELDLTEMTFNELVNFVRGFGQALIEILAAHTEKSEGITDLDKVELADKLLKDANTIALMKMKALGRIPKVKKSISKFVSREKYKKEQSALMINKTQG